MKVGFFEKEAGHKSMMRLLAFLGFLLGGFISSWGMVLVTRIVSAVIKGSLEDVSILGTVMLIVSGGLVLAGGGEALKVIQQRSEVKQVDTSTELK